MERIRRKVFQISQALTRRDKQFITAALDVVVAPLSFLLASMFTYASLWPETQLSRLVVMFPVLALAGGFATLVLGLPKIKLKTYQTFGPGGLAPYAGIVGGVAFLTTMLPGLHFPVVGALTFTLILFLAAYGGRLLLLKIFLWVLSHHVQRARVLIYGAGTTGLQLVSALKVHDGIQVVAFVDDDPSLHFERLAGLRIHPAEAIEALVANLDIARVILAMPSVSMPKQARIGRRLQSLGLEVQVLPSFGQLVGTEVLADTLTPLAPAYFLGRDNLEQDLTRDHDSYRGRTVMVSGAGGTIGSELCRQLLGHFPRRLVLFEVSELALYNIDRELRDFGLRGSTQIVPILGSVTDARAVRQAIEENDVEVVLHAAAYKHVPMVEKNPIAGLNNNVLGTRTLADACVKQGVSRFILISTDKAVRPTNVMGASKRLAEMVVQDQARRSKVTQFSIVRFGNVLGSSGSVIPLFKEQIARGGPVTLTHNEVTRYFMTISEAVQLVLVAGTFDYDMRQGQADVFVLDMGKPILIRQLAEQLIDAAGYTLRDEQNPSGDIEIKVVGLRPGEKLHEELLIGQDMETTPHPKIKRAAEDCHGIVSVPAAVQELGRLIALGDAQAVRQMALDLALAEGDPSGLTGAAAMRVS